MLDIILVLFVVTIVAGFCIKLLNYEKYASISLFGKVVTFFPILNTAILFLLILNKLEERGKAKEMALRKTEQDRGKCVANIKILKGESPRALIKDLEMSCIELDEYDKGFLEACRTELRQKK
jgi:hypothetical protein